MTIALFCDMNSFLNMQTVLNEYIVKGYCELNDDI